MTRAENSKAVVRAIVEEIWNQWRAERVADLIARAYTIHRDPLDPWDGKTLDHAAFKARLSQTRAAFPDQRFAVEDMIAEGDKAAVRWTCEGTHQGDPRFGPRLQGFRRPSTPSRRARRPGTGRRWTASISCARSAPSVRGTNSDASRRNRTGLD
jgi:hypothetical protein